MSWIEGFCFPSSAPPWLVRKEPLCLAQRLPGLQLVEVNAPGASSGGCCFGGPGLPTALAASLWDGVKALAVGLHACRPINPLLFFAFWHSVGRQEPVQ